MKAQILSMLVLSSLFVYAQRLIPASVRIEVKDDTGAPVTNAVVTGCFLDDSRSGASDRFCGSTDVDGTFSAQGMTMLGVYIRLTKEGYYQTKHSQDLKAIQRPDGKGPMRPPRWDVTVPVLLKRVRNPIPMRIAVNRNPYVSAYGEKGKYCLDRTSCYDLVKGSFLPPYGDGVVPDIVFEWRMSIFATNKVGRAIEYDTRCTILMTNVVDGVCKGRPDGDESGQSGSAFISDYKAPDGGYTNAVSFYRNVRGTKAESNDDRHHLYYFRIRTQTNEQGQVTHALYGKIHGQLNGNFTCYLNPTPEDRNVEHDQKRSVLINKW